MSGLELIEPTLLYNLLNEGTSFPALSDPNYLLLIDARKKHEYNESHIITAKKAPKNESDDYIVPYDAELECKYNVIVYDGNTSNLKDDGPAIDCANMLWDKGSRNPVKILKGGYEDFSALYPFLMTQKIIYMPRELDAITTYPAEILPGQLYLGRWQHGNTAYIQKDLKIKAHVNCAVEPETFFKEEGPFLMHIPVEDNDESDIHSKFQTACEFIDDTVHKNQAVLVFSEKGISRSVTIVLAYLMHKKNHTLEEAWRHVKQCFTGIRPNRAFVKQLSKWEAEIFGQATSNIEDPNF